ncbi:hypothetical protein [Streptomyces bugieae]|uniref:Uncharacterized protein n=1 Tax=Streptomyces bugieae TaxID=3098223 RepID=A0ABU7NL42_9ACTN|nr:hypothetical protein [Streptomyces sp. DSM 41528]
MPGTPTEIHVSRAEDGVNGKNPMHGFSVQDGPQRAVPHALLALVTEQQATNAHLAAIADSLDRIATALAKPTVVEPAPEPKRRLWLPKPRTA